MVLGTCIVVGYQWQSLFNVAVYLLVEGCQCAAFILGSNRCFGTCGIGQSQVFAGRRWVVGHAKGVGKGQCSVCAAQQCFAFRGHQFTVVALLFYRLEGRVGRRHGHVQAVPQFLRRFRLLCLGDVAPRVGLVVKSSVASPARYVELVGIVRIQFCQIGRVVVGVGRNEVFLYFLFIVQLHAVVGQLVEKLVARTDAQRCCGQQHKYVDVLLIHNCFFYLFINRI